MQVICLFKLKKKKFNWWNTITLRRSRILGTDNGKLLDINDCKKKSIVFVNRYIPRENNYYLTLKNIPNFSVFFDVSEENAGF